MLRQRADAQLHRAQLLEVLDELRRGDADEAGRQAALRHECLRRPGSDSTDGARDFDVLREIEVVDPGAARGLRNRDIAVERQTGDDGVDRVAGQVLLERVSLLGIQGDAR